MKVIYVAISNYYFVFPITIIIINFAVIVTIIIIITIIITVIIITIIVVVVLCSRHYNRFYYRCYYEYFYYRTSFFGNQKIHSMSFCFHFCFLKRAQWK